jgi:hypothetical protein
LIVAFDAPQPPAHWQLSLGRFVAVVSGSFGGGEPRRPAALAAAELLQMAAQLAVVLQQPLLALEHRLQALRKFALKDVWQCLKQGFQIGDALLCVAQLLFSAFQSPLQVLF